MRWTITSIMMVVLIPFALQFGCGEQGGDLFFNLPAPVTTQLTLKAGEGTDLPEGANVDLRGSIVLGWNANPDTTASFGTVEGGMIKGSYTRTVGDGVYTIGFLVHDGDKRIPVISLKVNGVAVNTYVATEFTVLAQVRITIIDGEAMIAPEGNSDLQEIVLRYTGTDPQTHPGLEVPAASDDSVAVQSSFSWPWKQPMEWVNDGWQATAYTLGDKTLLARFEDASGIGRLPGCWANGTLLINMRSFGDPQSPWRVFEAVVSDSGTVQNPRPLTDERYGTITVSKFLR